jgi:uncharacterized protein (UPF0262 family)
MMRNLNICDYNSLYFLSESKLKIILKPYFKKNDSYYKKPKAATPSKKIT